ncbi:MAG: LCP family protein, partial [Propionibacteriaceae bacterium]|nr:LCP family protein [Propionibacteriaceae bacterium]
KRQQRLDRLVAKGRIGLDHPELAAGSTPESSTVSADADDEEGDSSQSVSADDDLGDTSAVSADDDFGDISAINAEPGLASEPDLVDETEPADGAEPVDEGELADQPDVAPETEPATDLTADFSSVAADPAESTSPASLTTPDLPESAETPDTPLPAWLTADDGLAASPAEVTTDESDWLSLEPAQAPLTALDDGQDLPTALDTDLDEPITLEFGLDDIAEDEPDEADTTVDTTDEELAPTASPAEPTTEAEDGDWLADETDSWWITDTADGSDTDVDEPITLEFGLDDAATADSSSPQTPSQLTTPAEPEVDETGLDEVVSTSAASPTRVSASEFEAADFTGLAATGDRKPAHAVAIDTAGSSDTAEPTKTSVPAQTADTADATSEPDDTEPDDTEPDDTDATSVDSGQSQRLIIGPVETPAPTDHRHRQALIWTVVSAIVPGLGLWKTQRRSGGVALIGLMALGLVGLLWTVLSPAHLVNFYFSPTALRVVSAVAAVIVVICALVAFSTYRRLRPAGAGSAGWALPSGLTVLLAIGLVGFGSFSWSQAGAVETAFPDGRAETIAPAAIGDSLPLVDPWRDIPQINVLLLGLDSTAEGDPIAQAIMVASVDTATGNTLLISVPSSLASAQFPEDSPLRTDFPRGWSDGANPSNPAYQLGAMYSNLSRSVDLSRYHSDNLGADGMKLAVGYMLGLTIDYYLALDLAALSDLVDGLGGITVNVNQDLDSAQGLIPAGADTELATGSEVLNYLTSGANDDARQTARVRCVIYDLVDQARPTRLARPFADLNWAPESFRSDVPDWLVDDLASLVFQTHDGAVVGMQFVSGQQGFSATRTSADLMRNLVDQGLEVRAQPAAGDPSNIWQPQTLDTFCAFNPNAGW